MNKTAKVMIVLGISLICIGMVFSLFNFNKIFSPFISGSEDYERKEIFPDDEISSIEIDTNNDIVQIMATTNDRIKITYYENGDNKYKTSNENGIFRLDKESVYQFLSLAWSTFETKVIIEIPREIILKYNIKTSNNKVEVNDLTLNNSIIKTSNGKISLNNVSSKYELKIKTSNASVSTVNSRLEYLNVETSNGKVNLDKLMANKIDVKTSNGSVNLNYVEASRIRVKTSNDRINFKNLIATDIEFKTSNGEVDGNIVGNEMDYKKEIKTSNSKIEINGIEYDKKHESLSGKYKLYIKTSNDNIDIDFN